MTPTERSALAAAIAHAIEHGNIMDRVIALEAAVRALLAAQGGK